METAKRKLSGWQREILASLYDQSLKTGSTLVQWSHEGEWTASERASESRSLRRLEQRGLLKRLNRRGDGRRTSHVELTETGLQVCRTLREAEAVNSQPADG